MSHPKSNAHARTSVTVLILCFLLISDRTNLLAQTPPAEDLKIIIIDGDNFTNNIKRRTARDPVVEVRDRDNKRVPGAAVAFLLPQSGPSGTFGNGSKLLNVVTDQNGRAVGTGLKPNTVTGKFQIQVTAAAAGLSAAAVITQTNVKGKGGLSHAALSAIVVAAVVAAILIATLATRGSSGKKTSISVGPPSLP